MNIILKTKDDAPLCVVVLLLYVYFSVSLYVYKYCQSYSRNQEGFSSF